MPTSSKEIPKAVTPAGIKTKPNPIEIVTKPIA
jgi:hypothetical protein